MKYPAERVVLSWDFGPELAGRQAKSIKVDLAIDRSSRVEDPEAKEMLAAEPWLEGSIVFQQVRGGVHGADYAIPATLERDDGLIFQKLSILPVRER